MFKKSFYLVTVFLCSVSFSSQAFELPKLGKKSDSSVDVASLESQQSDLIKLMNSSLKNLNQSQQIIAEALGLKEAAAAAKENNEKLAKGELTSKDDIEKVLVTTQSTQKSIDDGIKASTTLDAQGKEKFTTALPPYGVGALEMVMTGKKASEAAKSLTNVIDPTILTKLGTLIYIGKNSPSLISTFTSSTNNIITFSKANGIDTSQIESKTSEWN